MAWDDTLWDDALTPALTAVSEYEPLWDGLNVVGDTVKQTPLLGDFGQVVAARYGNDNFWRNAPSDALNAMGFFKGSQGIRNMARSHRGDNKWWNVMPGGSVPFNMDAFHGVSQVMGGTGLGLAAEGYDYLFDKYGNPIAPNLSQEEANEYYK